MKNLSNKGIGIAVPIILLVITYFFYPRNIKIVKCISDYDAEYSIKSQILNIDLLKQYNSDEDTIYKVIKVENKKISDSTIALMVKNNCQFHVYQDNRLIFLRKEKTYYQGKSIENKKYFNLSNKLRNNQSCYQIKIQPNKPIFVLIRALQKDKLKELIALTDFEEKNINSLKNFDIPIFRINNQNSFLLKESYCSNVTEISQNGISTITNSKMKIRGYTSLSFPKKQFSIKFRNKLKLKNIDLKKNVLLSSYIDKSLIRNKLAKDLFSELRDKPKSSEYVHLIINDIYEGLYILFEHPDQEFKKTLVDTSKTNFLIQIDRGQPDFKSISNKYGFIIRESNKAINEVKDKTRYLETMIKNNDLSIIDINSFIDYIIISELTKNIDAYRLSTYITFKVDKFSIDIVWDFDQAFGLSTYHNGHEPFGFIIESELTKYIPSLFNNLWENKTFKKKLINRYKNFRKTTISEKNISDKINAYYEKIFFSAELNFQRWNIIDNEIWPNHNTFKSYKEEIEYVKSWSNKRLKWLDSQWN